MNFADKRDLAVIVFGWNFDGTTLFDIPIGQSFPFEGYENETVWNRDVTIGFRNLFLERSDWRALPDSPLSDTERAEWIEYRQALRDLTADPAWPDMQFPVPPDMPFPLALPPRPNFEV